MHMSDSKPVAIVTGATGGMGVEIVRELAATHRVIAVGRNSQQLADLAAKYGAIVWEHDITDYAVLQQRVAELDRLNVLVNGAAIGLGYSVHNADAAQWEKYFAVNVIAAAELTRAVLPLLRESEGTVVFIGSGASTKPSPGNALYVATKHALKGMADTLRIDEAKHRLRVVTVAPGPTDTAMLQAAIPADEYEAAAYIDPATVAKVVKFVVDAPVDAQLTDVAVRPRIERK